MNEDIAGYRFPDDATRDAVREIENKYGYVMDPHGAVGYLALREHQQKEVCRGVILETAHPAKFLDDMEAILGKQIVVPERLAELADKEKVSVRMPVDYSNFKEWLLQF